MNTEILKRLNLEKLRELQKAVELEISSRLDTRIYPGRTGYFMDGKGVKHFVEVERINSKSITVKPVGGGRGGWRLPASMLVLNDLQIATERKVSTPTTAPSETYNVDAW